MIKIGSRINFTTTDETYDNIIKTCDKLNISIKELMHECIFHFFTTYQHDISRRMKEKFIEKKLTKQQKDLFFVKNCFRQIIMQSSWRVRTLAECKHKIILETIKLQEQKFSFLDEETQNILRQEFKEVTALKNERVFDHWVDNKLGIEDKELKIIKRIK